MTTARSRIRNRAIGAQIQEARRRRGISQSELAQAIGVHGVTISHFEQGAVKVPEGRLRQLAAALSVSVAELVQDVPKVSLSRDEVELVRTLRALPEEGRAYIAHLMAGLASGEVAR